MNFLLFFSYVMVNQINLYYLNYLLQLFTDMFLCILGSIGHLR